MLTQDSVDVIMNKEPSRQLKRSSSLPQSSSNQNTASLSHVQSKNNKIWMTRFTMKQIELVVKLYKDQIYGKFIVKKERIKLWNQLADQLGTDINGTKSKIN